VEEWRSEAKRREMRKRKKGSERRVVMCHVLFGYARVNEGTRESSDHPFRQPGRWRDVAHCVCFWCVFDPYTAAVVVAAMASTTSASRMSPAVGAGEGAPPMTILPQYSVTTAESSEPPVWVGV
jgi:hypothetical protein